MIYWKGKRVSDEMNVIHGTFNWYKVKILMGAFGIKGWELWSKLGKTVPNSY